jgi:hypothetical protein
LIIVNVASKKKFHRERSAAHWWDDVLDLQLAPEPFDHFRSAGDFRSTGLFGNQAP